MPIDSDGNEQFDLAISAVRGSADPIALGKDGRGEEWFTSWQMVETSSDLGAHRNCLRNASDIRAKAQARK